MSGWIDLGPTTRVRADTVTRYDVLPCLPASKTCCEIPRRIVIHAGGVMSLLFGEEMDIAIGQLIAAKIAPPSLRAEMFSPPPVEIRS